MAESTVTCHCGAVNFKAPIALPATSELCHCNPCRQTSGALFEAFAPLPDPPPSSALDNCTAYATSKPVDRYFCTTCGTKVFLHVKSENRWSAIAGAIDPPKGTENVLKVKTNEFVNDTIDGGLAPFMTKLGGRNIPCYENSQSEGKELSPSDLMKMTETAKSLPPLTDDALLTAECHCGGVSIRIKPADHAKTNTLAKHIPVEKDKYNGSTCVCRDCRLHQGVPLTTWLYIPSSRVLNPHTGQPIAHLEAATSPEGEGANKGLSLTHYFKKGEEWGAYRAFCSTCGASVFYDFDDRPEITNVAPGLIRAEEGVLARRWICWEWGWTSWKDSYVDREIRDAWIATGGGVGS